MGRCESPHLGGVMAWPANPFIAFWNFNKTFSADLAGCRVSWHKIRIVIPPWGMPERQACSVTPLRFSTTSRSSLMIRLTRLVTVVAMVLGCLGSRHVRAATLYWNTNGTTRRK